MSDTDRAQQIIVGSLAASVAVASGAALADGEAPGARLLVGTAFVGVALSAGSMFSPRLASGFAVLILASSVFLYGAPLYDAVQKQTSPRNTPSRATGTGGTPRKEVLV